MTPEQAAELERLVRAMQSRAQAGDAFVDRAIAHSAHADAETIESARRELGALGDGQPLPTGSRGLWEAIVHEHGRPAIPIVGDQLQNVPWPWTGELGPADRWTRACQAVGRLAPLHPHPERPYLGTGVVVGDGLMLTNRHVAAPFVHGVGERDLRLLPDLPVQADLRQEIVSLDAFGPVILHITDVALVHPHWDLALLRFDPDDFAGRTPVELAVAPPAEAEAKVLIIGFPYKDDRNDPALQQRIFGTFGDKRAQPGVITALVSPTDSYQPSVDALAHDCSTLGGNSGSPLFELATGKVIGLHFKGEYLKANHAVPSWELARDSRLVDLGLFEPRPASPDDPWDADFAAADRPLTELVGPQPTSEAPVLDAALYERLDDDGLRERLTQDPGGTTAGLVALLGPEEARVLLDDLDQAGPAAGAIDPQKPELVYLHGILGGHLRGPRRRVWFAPLAFASGDLDHRLTLGEDGLTGTDQQILTPDGHLRLSYAKAARRWRRQGFAVHEWSFDWRRPVVRSARRLRHALAQLVLDRPGREFVLVAHSMGGLVAMIYATLRGSKWRDQLRRVVLLGSPLGGSYAPLECGIGTYPFLEKLAWLTRGADAADMAAMARSLPGLLDMLPHPSLNPSAEALYDPDTWGDRRPLTKWLARSRELKARIWESELLSRATALATITEGTVTSHQGAGATLTAGQRTGAGDGTVPAWSAVHPHVDTWQVHTGHSDLPNDDTAIAAVARLALGEQPDGLERLSHDDLPQTASAPEAVAPGGWSEAHGQALSARLAGGDWTAGDVAWLRSNHGAPVPAPPATSGSGPLPVRPVQGRPGAAWRANATRGGTLGPDGLSSEQLAAARALAQGHPETAWPRWTLRVTPTQGAPGGRIAVIWRVAEANQNWRLCVALGDGRVDWVAPTPPASGDATPGAVFDLLLPAGEAPQDHGVLAIPGPPEGVESLASG